LKSFIELIFDKFENFATRAMIPSIVIFVIILVIVSLMPDGDNKQVKWLIENLEEHPYVSLLFFIGLSHVLAIVTQAIFDNRIKKRYDACWFCANDDEFTLLRGKVCGVLKTELDLLGFEEKEISDYMLYQIIGKLSDIDTKHYVDQAKHGGIVFSALMGLVAIVIAISLVIKSYWLGCVAVFVLVLLYLLGIAYISSRYKSRAIRIYTNFLLDRLDNLKEDNKAVSGVHNKNMD
jgi:hypothetical protein